MVCIMSFLHPNYIDHQQSSALITIPVTRAKTTGQRFFTTTKYYWHTGYPERKCSNIHWQTIEICHLHCNKIYRITNRNIDAINASSNIINNDKIHNKINFTARENLCEHLTCNNNASTATTKTDLIHQPAATSIHRRRQQAERIKISLPREIAINWSKISLPSITLTLATKWFCLLHSWRKTSKMISVLCLSVLIMSLFSMPTPGQAIRLVNTLGKSSTGNREQLYIGLIAPHTNFGKREYLRAIHTAVTGLNKTRGAKLTFFKDYQFEPRNIRFDMMSLTPSPTGKSFISTFFRLPPLFLTLNVHGPTTVTYTPSKLINVP